MSLNLNEYFVKYEAVVQMVDGIFEKMKTDYPKEVFCRERCCDCCYALFDITVIEAAYLNQKFRERFFGKEKNEIIETSAKTDRALYKIKREIYRESKEGKNEVELLAKAGAERVRCPLLGKDDLCLMYDVRPVTCRLYGIPTSSAGMSHICGRTNFKEGEKYPTVNMDKINAQLQYITAEMLRDIKSKHVKMHEMLIPVSMALITDFNDSYFGVE